MADEYVFNINLSPQGMQIAQDLKDLGAGSGLEKILTKRLGNLTKAAHKAAKSTIPEDTGELMDTDMSYQYNSAKNEGVVLVFDITHLGRRKQPVSASWLANYLDTNKLRRSRAKMGAGSVSQFWIKDAGKLLNPQINELLNG